MAEQDQSKLLPCPFCGGDGKMIHPMGEWVNAVIGYGPDGSRIACAAHDCTVYSPSFHGPDQDAQAIEWWNTRAPTPDAVNADKALVSPDAVIAEVQKWLNRQGGFNAYAERVATGATGWSQLRSHIWLTVYGLQQAATPAPDKALMPEAAVGDAASMALMYLETGFIECERCGDEIPTETLDAVWTLREAGVTPAPTDVPATPAPVEEPEKRATCSDCLPHDDPGENTRCADCPHLIAEAREAYAEPTTIVKAGKCGRHYDKDCDACQKALAWNDGELDRLRAALAATNAGQVEAVVKAANKLIASCAKVDESDPEYVVHGPYLDRLRSALTAFKKSEVGHE